jgi:hypothetical protein
MAEGRRRVNSSSWEIAVVDDDGTRRLNATSRRATLLSCG